MGDTMQDHEAMIERARRTLADDGTVWPVINEIEIWAALLVERQAREEAEAERVDPSKVAAMSDALHTMVRWYYDVPFEVRKRWVAMPEVVKGYIDSFGPWLETAPWDPERFRRAMKSVGYDGDADFIEDALRAEVDRERRRADACSRIAERVEARAEEAERRADVAKTALSVVERTPDALTLTARVTAAEARVDKLTAALRVAIRRLMEIAEPWEDDDPEHLNPPSYNYAIDYALASADEARAVLGEQEAPEPTCPSCRGVEMDPPCEDPFHEQDEMVSAMWRRVGEQEAPTEPLAPIERPGTEGLCKWRLWSLGREYECDLPADHDGDDHQFRGVPWPSEYPAPQEAPEPERPLTCPQCGSDDPTVQAEGCGDRNFPTYSVNAWHRSAPLVEGEQG